ncbi:trace amine-associated receptor 13c-like [Pygocentrus nattereri]|uniref:G-protein coupled receptors family 1 profile domain-containing protein n=1 Tax=Pygocentrus nattereri TaxID=42514 RepID=A0A3B4CWL3_PYGNA|nr:trace amine-associated receptor 13c-like [Pygocentrus nattereri]
MNLTEANRSDNCPPYTCPERSVSTAVYMLLYVCAAAVVLLTVCGNLLIIISVCHFKQLHTPTNMLILSLAASDFLVGVFVMPTAFIWLIESCWVFKSIYCMYFLCSAYFLSSMSIYSVVLIAVDRYFALSNPFLYTKTISVSTMCIAVLCDWFLLLSYNLGVLLFNLPFTSLIMCPGDCYFLLDEVWSLVDLLVTFVFPLAVIIILYTLVFVIARKHATAIRGLNVHTRTQASNHVPESMKSEKKAAKVLGILVSVFLAFLLPYFIYVVLGNVIDTEVESYQKVLALVCLNSTVNPVIYALFYPWFRKCVKLTLTLQIFNTDSSLINVL